MTVYRLDAVALRKWRRGETTLEDHRTIESREGVVYLGEAREGDRLVVCNGCAIVVNPKEPPMIIDSVNRSVKPLTPEEFPEVYAEFEQRVWFSQ
jgi:hypothetical protein